ncbi:MAG: 50S ribosomal protein L17 [Deltaproteobacteria bacterium]|nr:50S ribosomal protein L17 [Deltaproteobacteria bacterium]MCL4874776.1 50S ribosomal protein L17 [bacterium]
MRHNRDEKRFDRSFSHLKSMLANMTNDLVMHGRIKTTTPRAKVLRRYAERMITLGKNGSLASRRRAMAFMRSKVAVDKLFSDVAPQYKERNGGYTRILKLGNRPGDNAPMSFIELVEGAAAAAEAQQAAKATKKTTVRKAKAPAKPKAASGEKKAVAKKAAPAKAKEGAEAKPRKAPAKKAEKKEE